MGSVTPPALYARPAAGGSPRARPLTTRRPGAAVRCLRGAVVGLATALLGLGAALGVAAADEPARGGASLDDPVLARLIDESLATRPELARTRAAADAERERVPQAGALPDPMLEVGLQNDGFTSLEVGRMETSFVSIMASQTFPWPGKRGLRGEVAALGVEAAEAAVTRARLSTEADVRRGYVALLLVRERLALLDRLDAVWRRALDFAGARYASGAGAQSELVRLQLELTRLEERRLGLRAEESSRLQALNRLRSRPLDEPLDSGVRLRELPVGPERVAEFSADEALARSPELAAARAGETRANRASSLAGKGRYPDLTVGAGLMVRGSLPPMWLATVGAPLPLYSGRKQERAVAEEAARVVSAGHEVAAIEQLLRLRSSERRTAYEALARIAALYRDRLLAQSAAAIDSTLAQYAVGQVSFSAALEATAGNLSDEERYLDVVAAAQRVLIAEREVSLVATPPVAGSADGGAMGMPAAVTPADDVARSADGDGRMGGM